MATETLVCQSCDSEWDREVKRGRKPKQCPECVEGKSKTHSTIVESSDGKAKVEFKKPQGKTWWCRQQVRMHKTCARYYKKGVTCQCKCHN